MMLRRSQALQIYMKPGLKEDDLMLRVWEACKQDDRPQNVFRKMLRAGLIAMVESGEMPESIIEECGLDSLVERRRKRVARHTSGDQKAIAPAAQPYPYYPPPPQPYPHAYPAHPYPVQEPTHYAPQPPVEPRRVEPPAYVQPPTPPAVLVPVAAPTVRDEPAKVASVQQEQGDGSNPSLSGSEPGTKRKLGKLM